MRLLFTRGRGRRVNRGRGLVATLVAGGLLWALPAVVSVTTTPDSGLESPHERGRSDVSSTTTDGREPRAGLGAPRFRVRLIGGRVVPKDLVVDGLPVGGLSGLDYDRRHRRWYFLSDDSEKGPARFYTGEVELDATGILGVRVTSGVPIRRTDSTLFPPPTSEEAEVADPESVRVDPRDGTLYWSSEGWRRIDGGTPALTDPWLRQMTPDGRHLRQTRQPATFRMSADETGPRRNLALEGLTLTTDGRQIVSAMEGPLHQDGPVPTPSHGAVTRLTWYDKATGVPLRQRAYPLDPVPTPPDPPTVAADNGVAEILAVDRHRYLVLERSYASGVGNSIRLYEIDVRGASNVLHDDNLRDDEYRPVRKRLVVDLADLGMTHIDNVEGMTWGPALPDGERTLVLVSDDNFNPTQVTQVIALGVR